MKLVILYGPPAAGKLTIANDLAKLANIKVFDNHQVIDIIEPIVTRKYADFADLIYKIQRSIVDAAVDANQQNVVITFPFAANLQRDVDFITNLTDDARKKGVDVYPVFLTCDEDTLRSRATEESRKAKGKITTVELMNTMIEKYDFKSPLRIEGEVTFDTDAMTSEEVAIEIKKLADLRSI